MNISQIFPTAESSFYNGTEYEIGLAKTTVDVIIILLCFPINSYVIWLIVTGTGNGLAAEFFSLNYSICEMFFCVEFLLDIFSYKDKYVQRAIIFFNSLIMIGRPMFQCLICVERYLAVVHPVTFLKLKPLRYRVICCVIVWTATFVSGVISMMSLFMFSSFYFNISIIFNFFLFFIIQLYFLVAVLFALKRSGPGDRRREQQNHMKRRAFIIILITTLSMLIIMIFQMIGTSILNADVEMCVGSFCFALAGLVQPLLLLYRVAKLSCIKCQ